MGKKYSMKAEPAGVINKVAPPRREGKKVFIIRFETNARGEISVSTNSQGFHPYEIVGFLEVAKADQIRMISEQHKK